MKKKNTEWENIFANKAIDKDLILKIYKHHLQLNIKKKMAEDINRHFSKDIEMAKKKNEKMLNIPNY